MSTPSTEKLLTEALRQPSSELAAATLLTEANLSAGTRVAILSDDIYATEGLEGTVEGKSIQGGQYVDVKLRSGMVVPIIATLLAPI
jgi:hypothetical protein